MNHDDQNIQDIFNGSDMPACTVQSQVVKNESTAKCESDKPSDHRRSEMSTSTSSLTGIIQGLLGCLRPVWKLMGKAHKYENGDDWTIPFEDIRELQWLGSGAQGAVFLGIFGSEQVAVKKVRNEKDTEIKHLRDLNHPNIVRFRYVLLYSFSL